MGGRRRMVSLMEGLLSATTNTIIFAFIASTILSTPNAVHGLAINQEQDQPDSRSSSGVLINPPFIQESSIDASSGQKRFSALLEWMRDPVGSFSPGKRDGVGIGDFGMKPDQLVIESLFNPLLGSKEARARRGGGKMWSKDDVKDNASRFNNRKIFIRI